MARKGAADGKVEFPYPPLSDPCLLPRRFYITIGGSLCTYNAYPIFCGFGLSTRTPESKGDGRRTRVDGTKSRLVGPCLPPPLALLEPLRLSFVVDWPWGETFAIFSDPIPDVSFPTPPLLPWGGGCGGGVSPAASWETAFFPRPRDPPSTSMSEPRRDGGGGRQPWLVQSVAFFWPPEASPASGVH